MLPAGLTLERDPPPGGKGWGRGFTAEDAAITNALIPSPWPHPQASV